MCQTCNLTPALGASKAVVLYFSIPWGPAIANMDPLGVSLNSQLGSV